MRFTIGLDNGRELDIEAPSTTAAFQQAAAAYPDASVIFTQPHADSGENDTPENAGTDTTDTTESN